MVAHLERCEQGFPGFHLFQEVGRIPPSDFPSSALAQMVGVAFTMPGAVA